MIVEYIRYELTTHQPADLIEAFAKAATSLQAAPECHGYDMAQCEDAPNALIVRILWASSDAHMLGFRKSPNFPPFFAAVRPFFAEIAEMKHYVPTDLAWPGESVIFFVFNDCQRD